MSMSINNSIIKLLNLKEKNLIFYDNFIDEKIINGIRTFIFNAYFI